MNKPDMEYWFISNAKFEIFTQELKLLWWLSKLIHFFPDLIFGGGAGAGGSSIINGDYFAEGF